MFEASTKFLIVDDFSTMRKIIKKVLEELGYSNIVEAVDGKNALDKLKELSAGGDPVQFVISDWNMPNMQGIDLLKACKQDEQFVDLPFMLVTAESEQSQIVEAVKLGTSEYLVKPFSAAVLKQKIEKVYLKSQASKKVA